MENIRGSRVKQCFANTGSLPHQNKRSDVTKYCLWNTQRRRWVTFAGDTLSFTWRVRLLCLQRKPGSEIRQDESLSCVWQLCVGSFVLRGLIVMWHLKTNLFHSYLNHNYSLTKSGKILAGDRCIKMSVILHGVTPFRSCLCSVVIGRPHLQFDLNCTPVDMFKPVALTARGVQWGWAGHLLGPRPSLSSPFILAINYTLIIIIMIYNKPDLYIKLKTECFDVLWQTSKSRKARKTIPEHEEDESQVSWNRRGCKNANGAFKKKEWKR